MSGDMAVSLIWFVGAFTLVLSSLLVRRLPVGDWVKMAAAWIVIFGLIFLIVSTWQAMT